ncbi:MAG: DUF3307 domain-containing protein [Pseudomonadota bacterium]
MESISTIGAVFGLLVTFQLKHFIADFPLQTSWMLNKRLPGWSFVLPLAAHCAVHAGITLLIVLIVHPTLWWLALVDFCVHFVMDRCKSAAHYLGRFNDPTRQSFWNCFGFDQLVHHLTHYFIIWQLAAAIHAA